MNNISEERYKQRLTVVEDNQTVVAGDAARQRCFRWSLAYVEDERGQLQAADLKAGVHEIACQQGQD
ncbi:hypothetical protein [Pseudomonas glycinae]|uniref:Uncharacterized protein n=1 Tax=Pseudomonas glycinae TaxID=1785145 RepID=A0ABN5FPK2_9PSED|nr:hypothetical protein [Pseudomonas glycinae]AUG97609.1 hypothetical protein AWU82_29805 [Pseudomonas glycinae]